MPTRPRTSAEGPGPALRRFLKDRLAVPLLDRLALYGSYWLPGCEYDSAGRPVPPGHDTAHRDSGHSRVS